MKKFVKKIVGILQWMISIFIIFFGLICLMAIGTGTGLSMLVSGVVIFPLLTKRIPDFKLRKTLLIIVSVVLFFVALVLTPTVTAPVTQETTPVSVPANVENLVEESQKVVKEEKEAKKKEKEAKKKEKEAEKLREQKKKEAEKKAKEEEKLKKEFSEWIHNSVDLLGKVAKKSEYKKWRKYSEDTLFPVWKEVILSEINTAELSNYDVYLISKAESLYSGIFKSTTRTKEIREICNTIETYEDKNKEIEEKYGGESEVQLMAESCVTMDLYVTQRLNKDYSDSLLGDIHKSLDDTTTDYSKWVAYEVKYFYGTALPGNACYVLHSNEKNPFPEEGVYTLTFYCTGRTVDLTNSQGFTHTENIYQLIDDPESLYSDSEMYFDNMELIGGLYDKLAELFR